MGALLGPGGRAAHRRTGLGAAYALRVVEHDDDEHPDLSSYTYEGDGVYEVLGLLGGGEDGLSPDGRLSTWDAWDQDLEEELPPAAMGRLYPACDS